MQLRASCRARRPERNAPCSVSDSSEPVKANCPFSLYALPLCSRRAMVETWGSTKEWRTGLNATAARRHPTFPYLREAVLGCAPCARLGGADECPQRPAEAPEAGAGWASKPRELRAQQQRGRSSRVRRATWACDRSPHGVLQDVVEVQDGTVLWPWERQRLPPKTPLPASHSLFPPAADLDDMDKGGAKTSGRGGVLVVAL